MSNYSFYKEEETEGQRSAAHSHRRPSGGEHTVLFLSPDCWSQGCPALPLRPGMGTGIAGMSRTGLRAGHGEKGTEWTERPLL